MADFIVTQQLGKGSYGSVSKVKRKQDNQFYAIKDVNIKKLQPREREDALNEIRIMASIKHKNIVRYCDAFTEKDSLFIVMEFAGARHLCRARAARRVTHVSSLAPPTRARPPQSTATFRARSTNSRRRTST